MTDISKTLEAKSDQLNAVDIMGAEPIITIREVKVSDSPQQPIAVYFDGDNNRPWKPSKGMRRILAAAWGTDSAKWIGKKVQLRFESTVMYAGVEVGGIQIKAVSDIPAAGLNCALTISRTKRTAYHVPLLVVIENKYPEAQFKKALPAMASAMAKGDMTLQGVIAQCQKTGTLSKEQLAELEKVAPVEINDEEDERM